MNMLFSALAFILAGGALPLISHRWFFFAKICHTIAVTVGCLWSMYGLIHIWQGQTAATISCPWLGIFTLSFSLDSVALVFLIPVFLVSPIITLYGYHYLNKPEQSWRVAVSQFFFSLLIVSMALVTLAANMVTFAIAWELMSVSSWFLVMFDFEKEEAQKAGYIYFLFTQTGALFIFAAFGLVYQSTGSFSFDQMGQLAHTVKLAVFILALIGFGSKAGVFPLHIWLPHAHPAAPSHISALLSGVMIKIGVYGIIRIYLLLDDSTLLFPQIILSLGMISGVLGVVYALGQHDIKRLLAYHSIENIGIILIGIGLGMLGITTGNQFVAVFGFAGGFLHVLNHAIFKSLLFMGAGAIAQKTGTRQLDQLGGLMKSMPMTGQTFLIGSVAISGLPPLNGFISEFLIYCAAFHGLALNGSSFLFCLFAIVSLAMIGGLASGCFTKVVGVVFLGEPRSNKGKTAKETGPAMRSAMILLALICILIGIWPEPFLQLVVAGLRDIAPLSSVSFATLGQVPDNLAKAARLLLALILGVFVLRRILYRKKPIGHGPTWGCGFTRPTTRMQYTGTSYARSVVDFHQPFVRVRTEYPGISKIFPERTDYKSKVDDIAEVGLNRMLLRPILRGVKKMYWIQHGRIQLYIAYIILTIAVLLLTV